MKSEGLKTGSVLSFNIAELQRTDQQQLSMDLRKSLAALQFLRAKITKRIQSIAEDMTNKQNFLLPFKTNRRSSINPVESVRPSKSLTLPVVLEEQYQSVMLENGPGTRSSSVFYFLEFLAKLPEAAVATAKLRFWLNAEGYRRLVWRLGAGVVSNYAPNAWDVTEPEKIDMFTHETHLRLRKEVYQIYTKTLAPILQYFPAKILNSFERYIAPLLATDAQSLDVYSTDFRTTIFALLEHKSSSCKSSKFIFRSFCTRTRISNGRARRKRSK
jgi:hypothetical protein